MTVIFSARYRRLEFGCRVQALQNKLNSLSPTSHPDVSRVLDGYRLFRNVWPQPNNGEKRNFPCTMFDSLFFDREGRLVRAVAYEPFRELLGLPEDGMLVMERSELPDINALPSGLSFSHYSLTPSDPVQELRN